MLHLTNGDVVADKLRAAGVPGEITVWADVLPEGPVEDGLPEAAWRERRVRFLAEAGYESLAEARARYEGWDARLARAREHDELALWLEHDLFDQLLLIRHLAWLSRLPRRPGRVTLLCLDRHPAVPRFRGLGQLGPADLAALLPARRPVTEAQVELGQRAWRAFAAPEPTALARLLEADTGALPFLAGALRRHLEEFPAVGDGLSLTERRALGGLAGGPLSGGALFRRAQDEEERPFLGDLSFYARLRDLARGPAPAVATGPIARLADVGDARLALTPLAARLLGREADWVRANGIDRWLGGVHLEGFDPTWRWDAVAGRLARRDR